MAQTMKCSSAEIVESSDDQNFNGSENIDTDEDILTVEIAGQCLSNLNWSADGTRQVYLHLSLSAQNLRDISVLSSFVHLQKVSISHNKIEDLSALSGMSSLLELDASHNRIGKLLDFAPPNNLKVVNMSYNCISEIPDLAAHHYLQNLDLDYNSIAKISGLSSCHRLAYLTMRHNRICRLEGLDNLPIKFLALSHNNVEKIENLDSLCMLQHFEIGNNRLRSLSGLEHHRHLDTVDLQNNEVIDLFEVRRISPISSLRSLNLHGNPICELPDYRLAVIFAIQQLTLLDNTKISVDEKVTGRNLFNPTIEYLAARDHMMHTVYAFLQPTRLLDITLPILESPYPMLVLVGPQGTGKKNLAQKLAEELPDYFGYAASHTTRLPYSDEVPGKDYHFLSLGEFETGIKMGAFLQTCSYYSELYGLSLEAIEVVARESLACVVHMELEGVLTLKNTYLEPRYVLLLPASRLAHERRLLEKGVYTEEQVEEILERAEFYAEYNRQHPGFFDTTHMSDDITETFFWLRRLVLQYLGLPSTPATNDPSDLVDPVTTDLSSIATGMPGFDSGVGDPVMERGRSAPVAGKRTWSRPSLTDCTGVVRSQTAVPAVHSAKLRQPCGAVEEESMKRRQSAIKEAIAGQTLPLFQQILERAVDPAQVPVLTKQPDDPALRWFSAPGGCAMARSTDDELSSSNSSPSCHSDTVEPERSYRESSDQFKPLRRRLPDETVLDLTTPSTCATSSNMEPRRDGTEDERLSRRGSEPISNAASGSKVPSSAGSGRPGSGRLPVLPPIRQLWSADAVMTMH